MGKPKGRSARVVSAEAIDGEVEEFQGQSAVEKAIFDGIHNKRFYLAEQLPICKGSMREAFGYLATTIAAQQVLAGTYSYPEGFEQATRKLFEACAEIRLRVPRNQQKRRYRTQTGRRVGQYPRRRYRHQSRG